MIFMVTVKLPRNPEHDPHNKIAGRCPVNGAYCSDTTGEHHTVATRAASPEEVLSRYTAHGAHVTRIEQVPLGVGIN